MKKPKALLWALVCLFIVSAAICAGCGDDDDDDDAQYPDDNADDDFVDDDADDDVDDDVDDDDQCDDGEVWDEERGECVPTECGTQVWPEPPVAGKALIYVNMENEGEADGSMNKPYGSIDVAISNVTTDTSILIAAGVYEENLMIGLGQDGVDLIGRCAALCQVRSDVDDNVLRIRQTNNNVVTGLRFSGDSIPEDTENPMIEVESTTGLRFEDNEVFNSPFGGMILRDSEDFIISGNRFETNSVAALYLKGNDAGVISNNEVYYNEGRGMNIDESTQIEISGNDMAGNEDVAIFFGDSTGEILSNSISDAEGRGISAEVCQGVTVSENTITGCEDHGIYVFDSSGTVSENEVDGNDRGIEFLSCDEMTISENILDGNTEVGIFFNEGASSEISDNEIYNTQPNAEGQFGYGLLVQDSTDMSVTDNVIDGNTEGGIIFINTGGAIEGNSVLNTAERQAKADGYTYGHGIHVQDSVDVVCDGNDVDSSVHHGIIFLDTANGEIINNDVGGTTSGSDDDLGGDGLTTVFADNVSVNDNVAANNERCGSVSDASTGMIQRNEITGNGIAIVEQNGSDMNIGDNDISDNLDNSIQSFANRELNINDEGMPNL